MKKKSTGKRQSDFFSAALRLATRASKKNEVPIGAVLVKDGEIIAKSFNQTEARGNFLAHAEMLCIQRATKILGSKYLNGCELYVTLEPCLMCLTAAKLSRVEKIFFLLKSPKFGSRGKAYFKTKRRKSSSGLTPSAVALLQAFFKRKR